MPVERFLGGAWASVHGPADPRALLVWTLQNDFRGLSLAPSPRPRDWRALRSVLSLLPARIAAVRVDGILDAEGTISAPLAATSAGERDAALVRIGDAVALAQSVGCTRVVLEPGVVRVFGEVGPVDLGDPGVGWTADRAAAQMARRNAQLAAALEAACRALHALCRRWPDITFCLTGSRHIMGLGEPRALATIYEDLRKLRLCYWHDAPIAARRQELLGLEQGEWLHPFVDRMAGISLGDANGGSLYLPPGAGRVDFPLLATYTRRFGKAIPAVLELDPGVEPGELKGVHAFLEKFGL